MITIVGVRRGDHVGDAIGRGRPANGDRDVPGFWPVVYFGEDVGVDIDHGCRASQPLMVEAVLINLTRFNDKDQAASSINQDCAIL